MKKSELQIHDAPRFPDYRDLESNPQKVFSDLNLIIKELWRDKIDLKNRVNLLEEKVNQIGGIRPPLRY